MSKKVSIGLELAFFALAMLWFVPVIKSDPSPYDYFPETAFVLVAMFVSRAFAYRNGRALIACVLEVSIVMVAFLAQRAALNIIIGQGM